jgi:hypothetical protein
MGLPPVFSGILRVHGYYADDDISSICQLMVDGRGARDEWIPTDLFTPMQSSPRSCANGGFGKQKIRVPEPPLVRPAVPRDE